MSKTNSELQADIENLCDQIAELRETLRCVIRLNSLGKTKEITDLSEITLGYRKK